MFVFSVSIWFLAEGGLRFFPFFSFSLFLSVCLSWVIRWIDPGVSFSLFFALVFCVAQQAIISFLGWRGSYFSSPFFFLFFYWFGSSRKVPSVLLFLCWGVVVAIVSSIPTCSYDPLLGSHFVSFFCAISFPLHHPHISSSSLILFRPCLQLLHPRVLPSLSLFFPSHLFVWSHWSPSPIQMWISQRYPRNSPHEAEADWRGWRVFGWHLTFGGLAGSHVVPRRWALFGSLFFFYWAASFIRSFPSRLDNPIPIASCVTRPFNESERVLRVFFLLLSFISCFLSIYIAFHCVFIFHQYPTSKPLLFFASH